jgi:transposase-like protein
MKQTIFSKDEYWQALIAEQKASGLSQSKFCSGRGISKSTFSQWISHFNSQRLEGAKSQESKPLLESKSKRDLVRVKIDNEKASAFRIIFSSGVILEFSERPEPLWITEMMKLIA